MTGSGVPLAIDRLAPYVRIAAEVVRPIGHGLPDRVINDHELLCFLAGEGRFRIAGHEHGIGPGTLFVIQPGVVHSFSAPEPGKGYRFLSLHFDPWRVAGREHVGYLGSLRPLRRQPSWLPAGADLVALPHRLVLRDPALYERLFAEIRRRFPMRDVVMTGAPLPATPAERVRLSSATRELLAFVIDQAAAPAGRMSAREAAAAERAAELLEADLRRMPPLAALARRVGLSRTVLARCFLLRHGAPPARWHLRRRIEAAKDELRRDARSIRAIADALGFASVHHFTRAFARICGLPPAAYRALHGEAAERLVPRMGADDR